MPARFYVRLSQLMILAHAFGLMGCESPTAPDRSAPVDPVVAIGLNVDAPTVERGAQLALAATALDRTGQPVAGRTVLWQSLDTSRVRVSAAGLLTGVTEGGATLRLTVGAVVRDVAVQVVAPSLLALSLSASDITLLERGEVTIVATLRNALGEAVTTVPITWESDDPTLAEVNGGTIRALREGRARIRARADTFAAETTVDVTPDFGGTLLFVADAPNAGMVRPRIYRMAGGIVGGVPEAVLEHDQTWQPAVSPDGSRIAFTCTSDGPAICVSNIDGSDVKVLTDGAGSYEDQPSWAPDGTRIAFRRWAAGASPGPFNPADIWVMEADGTGQFNLTDDATSQSDPSWSPVAINGIFRIAFVQDSIVDGYRTARIAMTSAFGGTRTYLTTAGDWVDERPRWAPDGRELVFVRSGGAFDRVIMGVNRITLGEWHFLYQPLPSGGQFDPSYSPNGRYIVFGSQHEIVDGVATAQVYTATLDGRDVRRRTLTTVPRREFAWIPAP